ncbi:MAG: hypothetical protein DIU80_000350 [Chloroflexota bacterium]
MSRFFLGFVIGALIGAAVVILGGRNDLDDSGLTLRAPAEGVRARIAGAIEAGRAAASARERELMAEYRSRLSKRPAGDRQPGL